MAKINEIVYDVYEAIREYTDDTDIDERYILYLYGIKRAKYLRQDLNNLQKVNDTSIQQSFCIGLEEVSINECNIDFDCDKILRTKRPLPTPIELHTKPAILSIKPTRRLTIPFNFISKDRANYIEGARFSNRIYSYYDNDNYVYVFSKKEEEAYRLLECLNITGIFSNPLELQEFCNDCDNCQGNTCFDEDTSEYPLQPHYIDLIRREIVSEFLQRKNIPTDTTNDGESTQK